MKTVDYPCEHGYYGLCTQCVREERDELRTRVAELERERDHAVRAAELQAEVPDGWQPISTAPRNGDRILVWREHSTFARAARFDPAHEEFFDDDRVHLHNLTHWMPMPKAPMDMHRAAVGQVTGPRRGVVEDVEDIHHMAECAAIMAVCGYFSRMRGPDAVVGPSPFGLNGIILKPMESGTKLYAGSAPVPAAQASDYWLDGKVIRKGKEYVAEIIGQEPLLLRELLTGKAAAQADAKVADDDAKPVDCSGMPESCPDNDGRGCHCSDKARTAALLAAKAKEGGK